MTTDINQNFYHPRFWPSWLGLGIMRLLALLPLPVLAALGSGLGNLTYYTIKSRRNVVQNNLHACFPDWTEDKILTTSKKCFKLVGQSVFYSCYCWWVPEEKFKQNIEITNRQHYDQALKEGKNIILLAPHFCGLEVGGYALNMERPMLTMYQHTKNQLVDDYVKRGRSRFGGVLVERKAPLRSLIKKIRSGDPFYYLPDQDARSKGVFAPFFGVQASTIPFLGKFASMSKAVVIPVSTRILPYGKGFEVKLGEPLQDFPCGDDIADTTAMNKAIEEIVKPMPEQYFWVHKRFKTRPEGEPSFY